MAYAIWLDIKLDQDVMPINVLSKFCDDPMKNLQVRELTKVKFLILTKIIGHDSEVTDV